MRGLLAPLLKLTAFVLVTVLATGILALTILNTSFTDSNTYSARFSDVTSLNEGDDVRIAGVRVGQVQGIEIADKNAADVTFSVDSTIALPRSVQAIIRYRNLIGQRYVSLQQGTDINPGATLPPGGHIDADHTKPALDLTQLFNGFQPLFQALNPEDVNKLSYEVIQVLQGEGGTVNSLLAHTASLTTKIADKDAVIGRVIDNLNSVLDTVNARSGKLSNLIVTVQQLVSGLAEDRKPIGDSISALSALADTTSGLLRDARPPLRNDIHELGRLTNLLNANDDKVRQFVQFLPKKLGKLTRTVSYGSWLNMFLCKAGGKVGLGGVEIPIDLPPSQAGRCTA